MQLELGAVVEGKVTGITGFGAFVALENGKNGLVHISDVANTYVSDINDFLKVGQTVRVKITGINEGKINLSIKKALEPERKPAAPRPQREKKPSPPQGELISESDDRNFEDKLKKFMQESDSRIADNPFYADRGKSRRRGK